MIRRDPAVDLGEAEFPQGGSIPPEDVKYRKGAPMRSEDLMAGGSPPRTSAKPSSRRADLFRPRMSNHEEGPP